MKALNPLIAVVLVIVYVVAFIGLVYVLLGGAPYIKDNVNVSTTISLGCVNDTVEGFQCGMTVKVGDPIPDDCYFEYSEIVNEDVLICPIDYCWEEIQSCYEGEGCVKEKPELTINDTWELYEIRTQQKLGIIIIDEIPNCDLDKCYYKGWEVWCDDGILKQTISEKMEQYEEYSFECVKTTCSQCRNIDTGESFVGTINGVVCDE